MNLDEADAMDASIWKSLPDEVVEKVLFHLPARKLLQLRIVCKRWLLLIDSPSFDTACTCRPAFLVTGEHSTGERLPTAFVYNTYLNRWYTLPVSSPRFKDRVCDESSLLGLHAFQSWKSGEFRRVGGIRVFNRVTGTTLRELPASSVCRNGDVIHPWTGSVSLVVQGSSYTVISAGCQRKCDEEGCSCAARCDSGLPTHTQVYDSVSNKWEAAGEIPWLKFRFMHEPYGNGQVVMAACGRFVYHVVIVGQGPGQDYRLVSFDLKRRVWIVVPGFLPAEIRRKKLTTLFERRGSLVLVLRHDLEDADRMRSGHWAPDVFSWDVTLSPDVQTWAEVYLSHPPTNLVFLPDEELAEDDYASYLFRYKIWCLGKGDHLMFVCDPAWGSQVLVYDMFVRAWTLTNFGVKNLDWTVSDLTFVQFPVLADAELRRK
ncbi:hypothetical protein Mapa_010485 [Marchantia paleacea]|nr:hypothetical protein Mapa_010485 [Marchantia paleacea]